MRNELIVCFQNILSGHACVCVEGTLVGFSCWPDVLVRDVFTLGQTRGTKSCGVI